MFIGLGKMIGKSKIRVGAGMRITKKNAAWILVIMMFVWMFQLMWYMMVLCFWLMYAVCYGIYWCIKKLVTALKGYRLQGYTSLLSENLIF